MLNKRCLPVIMESNNIINVFWTGGMDSTFNLIQKLLTTSNSVLPHYIVRHEDSTGKEIDTMITLRRAIIRKFPGVRTRFLPTNYTNEDYIPKFTEIDEEIKDLRKKVRVHEQYQILANYCKAYKIEKIDVSYELQENDANSEGMSISQYIGRSDSFKCFVNPLEKLTKSDTYSYAKSNNWHDLLNMTSFCRRPKEKNSVPCGTCGSCVDVVKEGLGFRLPFSSRIKAKIQIPFRKYWRRNFLKHDRGIFKIIKHYFITKF